MSESTPLPRVTPYRLTASAAQRRIRSIAECSANVILGSHARQRMQEREICDVDVFRALRTGVLVGVPEPAEQGEWKCKVVQRARGGRDVGVVAIILRNGKLFLKTAEWEDQT